MFYSTNKNSPLVNFEQALLTGQAPDEGIYMPKNIPKISVEQMSTMSYHEIAFSVLKEFVDIPEQELRKLIEDAYDYKVPIEKVNEKDFIMRLDQGPTASFKDFAARMMSRLMQYYLKKQGKNLIVLVATSGDTGGAIANAFYNLGNINIVILMPHDEISNIQRKQMTTLEKNITPITIDGKFDDCQALVKQAFADPELKNLSLSSANSINIGRLLPQAVYYFYAYSRIKNDIFCVPCGNFGNLVGGLIAKRMGLPVKFIAAVNENDEFPRFLQAGVYKPIKPSKKCLSNAMNVGHPSNLARLIDLYNGQMDEKGNIVVMPDMDLLKKDIYSISITDEQTVEAVKDASKQEIVIEPHGAVAWSALEKYPHKYKKAVMLETAHPAKFPEELNKLGIYPEQPDSLKGLENKHGQYTKMKPDYKMFKGFLLKTFPLRDFIESSLYKNC